jgi:hypothetical protein
MLKQLINDRLRSILSDFIYFDESSYNFSGALGPTGGCAAGHFGPKLQQTFWHARLRFAGGVARVATRSAWSRAHRPRARARAGSVTSCQVLLENVRIKESAFAQLGLPIRVKSGVVGKLDLGIPFGHLYTRPVRASVAPSAAAQPVLYLYAPCAYPALTSPRRHGASCAKSRRARLPFG